MKILQLCNKVPFPPKDGGCIAMNNITQGLIQLGHQVKVLAINTEKHFTDINTLPDDYLKSTNMEAVFIDTKVKLIPALFNIFTTKSYNITRFYSKAFEDKLIEILNQETFDIIQLESLYVSMYIATIRKYSKAKIVLRTHNVEHKIWERNAENTFNPIKKWYLYLLAKRLKRYELNVIRTIDAIAAITKEDEIFFANEGSKKPISTFPFGVDINKWDSTNEQEVEFPSLFHIGAMDWQPNIDGINWFLNGVWNIITLRHQQLKLYLAGRKMSDKLKSTKKKNVVIVGEVEDSLKFINSKSIMIVPLFSGGGMRVKIIEGMAAGKTIVSTAIGAEGIEYENGKNILIANNEYEFLEEIYRCTSNKEFCDSIGKNAKQLVNEKYNNLEICKYLTNFYKQLNP